jgi:hypothetical protein
VTPPCTVVIAAPHHLAALKARLASADVEHLEFSDTDALHALEAITKKKPAVVAFERLFAATPRGAALINRIKADPALTASEIRVVAHDSAYMRVSPRKPAPAVPPLDQRGTRRAPRFKVKPSADATVDNKKALIIDLSTIGAQVTSGAVMKPNQRVKVVLSDEAGRLRFEASVAWASYEITKSGPRYRAGLEFLDADPVDVDAYTLRHKA